MEPAESVDEEITEYNGPEAEPTSMILAGVHGNERCGIEAFETLLPLSIERGRVLVGYGNPRAIKADVRFTETNLNRMFKPDAEILAPEKNSYEYKRAQFLKQYLDQADALLDIHASFTPNGRAFIICEANAQNITKYLPLNLVVSGLDEVQLGGTDYYMNRNGKIGICIECGYLGDKKSTEVAEESILAFLKARGHIAGEQSPYEHKYMRMDMLYRTKTGSFALTKPFDDFENISKDQVIGIDGDEEVKAPYDGIILFARNRNTIGDEAFLLGKKKNSLA